MWGLGLARRLDEAGVLGINQRNAEYTLIYNQRRLYPLVDDKLLTKELARKAGVAVPELYGVIEIQRDVKRLRRGGRRARATSSSSRRGASAARASW